MTKSPCLTCPNLLGDKNGDQCQNCQPRLDYLAGIGPAGLPSHNDNLSYNIKKTGGKSMEPRTELTPFALKPFSEKVKKYSKCKELKPLDEFSKKKKSSDGLEYNCKVCKADYVKEYKKRNNKSPGKPGRPRKEVQPAVLVPGSLKTYPLALPMQNHNKIILDFSDHLELIAAVKEQAKLEFRPPEFQIMAILSKAFKGGFLEEKL